jgi:hypothetical protein
MEAYRERTRKRLKELGEECTAVLGAKAWGTLVLGERYAIEPEAPSDTEPR